MDLFGAEPVYEEEIEEFAPPVETPPSSPRTMRVCLGHEGQELQILKLFNDNHMPHALIFAGLEGIGKSTLGFRLARFLLAQEAEGGMFAPPPPQTLDISPEHPASRKVASGAHPDFLSIERKVDEAKGKKAGTLDIAEIRKIVPFLRLSSSDGGWRVVLVDDADMMGRGAQNAILKILEEPPPKTLIILIAHRPGALIPTIRSRARTMLFKPPAFEHFEQILHILGQSSLNMQEMKTLYTLAEASPGKALFLLEEGGLDILSRLLESFAPWPNWRWSDLHKLAENLGRSGADTQFESFSGSMLWIAQSLVKAKARGTMLSGPLQTPVFQSILEHYSLNKLSDIAQTLQDHLSKTDYANLEKREAVLRCFSIWAT